MTREEKLEVIRSLDPFNEPTAFAADEEVDLIYNSLVKVPEKEQDTFDTQESVRQKIKSLPTHINVQAQNRHIKGTDGYNQYVLNQTKKGEYGPSIFTGTLSDAQNLVDTYAGTGHFNIRKDRWDNTETIKTEAIIGIVVNNLNGVKQLTANFKIHYARTGVHIVPGYDRNRKGMKA